MAVLLAEGIDRITNLAIEPRVAARLGVPLAGDSWVRSVGHKHLESEEEMDEKMPILTDFHKKISGLMAAHLSLVRENVRDSTWLAGAILSKNAADAREAAIALVEHIGKTPARHRTSFEKVIFSDRPLWANLRDFSAREPPTVVWGAKGTFAPLYRFLAPRYLSCPDHVLDVERQHAVWQWVLARRRSLKLKSLNA